MSDEALVLLREIRDALHALPAALAAALDRRHRAPRHLSQADETALAILLPAIFAAVCGRPFTLRELMAHAELSVAPAVALRGALAAIDPRQLRRLLRRGADCGVEGFAITALKITRTGVQWRVECGDQSPHNTAGFASPRRVTVKSASWKP